VNSTEAWADEVSHCLGHRRARISREPIDSLVAALRQWCRPPIHGQHTFIWTGDSQKICSAYIRYVANRKAHGGFDLSTTGAHEHLANDRGES
jgi:hypothetical protein